MSMSVANSSTYLNPNGQGRENDAGFWGRKSGLEKKLLIGCGFLALLTVALVISLAVISSKKENKQDSEAATSTLMPITDVPINPSVCDTKECIEAARYLSMRMNLKADPCEDFHEYVCGKWVQDTLIPDDKGSYGVFEGLEADLAKICIEALKSPKAFEHPNGAIDNTRAFYQGCLTTASISKEEGVSQLRSLLLSLNISVDPTNNETVLQDFQTYKTLSQIVRRFGQNFILSFSVEADNKNNTRNLIFLDQPSTFGLGRSFLVNGSKTDNRTVAYKEFIKSSLCLMSNNSLCNDEVVQDIYDLEVNMAKLTRDPVDRRDADTWYYPKTVSDLDKSVPQINILEYLQDILVDSGADVTATTEVVVKEETYLKNVSQLLENTNTSIISNYLGWRLVQSLGPALFKDMRDIKFKFDMVNGGISKPVSEEERCFKLTNDHFGHAVGRLYVDKKFERSSKEDVLEMVHYLANAFRELLKENGWMDDETRARSVEKLDKMNAFIGYPEWIKDDAELDEFYQVPPMNSTDFFSSYQDSLRFLTNQSFASLNTENNRTDGWITQASIVNAYYNPSANSITFPAGILQIPFYGKRLKVLNYGAIGYVIGHEITHGYDDEGSQYDGEGNMDTLWSNETKKKFNERKECFIEQYSAIKDKQTGLNLNGAQTIGENIADNGGIREAYKAYSLSGKNNERLKGLEEFSDLQLFYISAATVWCTKYREAQLITQIKQNVHSPGMYRAYLPLANTDDFAKVFNCPPNSKMNPEKRCRIW